MSKSTLSECDSLQSHVNTIDRAGLLGCGDCRYRDRCSPRSCEHSASDVHISMPRTLTDSESKATANNSRLFLYMLGLQRQGNIHKSRENGSDSLAVNPGLWPNRPRSINNNDCGMRSFSRTTLGSQDGTPSHLSFHNPWGSGVED